MFFYPFLSVFLSSGKHVVEAFLRRFDVRMRARQRNTKLPKESYRKDLLKWHATTREKLVRSGTSQQSYDSKWGYF